MLQMCEEACEDAKSDPEKHVEACHVWASQNECQNSRGYMMKHCAMACPEYNSDSSGNGEEAEVDWLARKTGESDEFEFASNDGDTKTNKNNKNDRNDKNNKHNRSDDGKQTVGDDCGIPVRKYKLRQ